MQVSEKGVYFFEPVQSLVTELASRPDDEGLDELAVLQRAIGLHVVWSLDSRNNLVPDEMSEADKRTVSVLASGCLIERLPEVVGKHSRSVRWSATQVVITGSVLLDARIWGSMFQIHDQFVHDTTLSPTSWLAPGRYKL